MKTFKEFTNESDVDIENVNSPNHKATSDMIYRLSKMLEPNSVMAKNIQKDFGSGYKKDFEKMKKLMDEISGVWEDMEMEITQDYGDAPIVEPTR